MVSSIAVGYLAREAEGIQPIIRFFESYRRFAAGHSHKLYVIAKGDSDPTCLRWLSDIIRDLPCEVLHFHELAGRDIAAYLWAVRHIEEEFVSFFNTFAVINGENWLAKLVAAYQMPNVGLVGATGSYESLLTDNIILNRLGVLVKEATYDDDLAAIWAPFHTKLGKLARRRGKRLLRRFNDAYRRRPSVQDRLATLPTNEVRGHPWESLIPTFPNPHIRSNGFLCSREELLGFERSAAEPEDKMFGFRFESGYGGLSHKVRERGQRLLVVDRAGRTYDIEDWPKSKTFRAPDTDNLLVLDNTTTHFYALPEATRDVFLQLTYGGNLLGIELNPDLEKFGGDGKAELDKKNAVCI